MSDVTILLLLVISPLIIVAGLIFGGNFYFKKLNSMTGGARALEGIAVSCLFSVLWAIIFFTKSSSIYNGPLLWLLFVVLIGLMIETPERFSFMESVLFAVPCAVTLFISTGLIAIIADLYNTANSLSVIGLPIAIFKGFNVPGHIEISNPFDVAPILFMLVSTSAFTVPGVVGAIFGRNKIISLINTNPKEISNLNKLITRCSQLIALIGGLIYAVT